MGATFNTYNIATTGMYVNQAGLSVVSNNLSNVTTTGYSRQQMVSSEIVVSKSGGTSYSCGTSLEQIYRTRDTFLDQTYRQINAKTEYYNTKNALLEDGQKLLNEYGTNSSSTTAAENGLQQTIKDFFDGWEQLSKDAGSQSTRGTVVEYADSLVETFNQINTQITEMQQDAGNRVKDAVQSLNAMAEKVVALNKAIARAETNNSQDGNLRDQRDALIDQMSALVNISVTEQANGALNVSIGGVSLVQGDTTHTLQTVEDGTGKIEVQWAELGIPADISSGSLKANLEESDQSTFTAITGSGYDFSPQGSSSLSDLRQGLNDLITTIVTQVNTLVQSGKDLYGNTGEALFVQIDPNKPLAIGNIQVNPAITADVNKIAAGTSGSVDDPTIAAAIKNLTDKDIFSYGGLSMTSTNFYESLVSWISTTGETASSNYDTQNLLLQQAAAQKNSISSVSQDEEMSKMIVYQNAYNASARVLSAIDSLLTDLIIKLGG